jgi:hypothetical protein
MNLQTVKPRAGMTRKYGDPMWWVRFPGQAAFHSPTLDSAIRIAYFWRLMRVTDPRDICSTS